jgi:hypothetical protein
LPNGTLLTPRMGSVRGGSAMFHGLAAGENYYWSIQAVDTSFAGSAFAPEQQFRTAPQLNPPTVLADGTFEIRFANGNGLDYDILVSTNLDLPPGEWTNIGAAQPLAGRQFRFTTPNVSSSRAFYLLRQL